MLSPQQEQSLLEVPENGGLSSELDAAKDDRSDGGPPFDGVNRSRRRHVAAIRVASKPSTSTVPRATWKTRPRITALPSG